MVQITQIIQKHTPDICTTAMQELSQTPILENIVQFSREASNGISNTLRGMIETQKSFPKLNKHSDACDYFGVNSAKNIQNRIDNQMALTRLKTMEQDIGIFPLVLLSSAPNEALLTKSLNNLKEKGIGRLTITDKIFGNGSNNGTHTIGLVYHRGKYIILDSLPETYPEIKDCHNRLVKFLGLNPKEVIFSAKPQQSFDEYTCNNWTHANLDAVIEYINNGGKDKEITPEILNEILPEDINLVLNKQFIYTYRKLKRNDIIEMLF